MYLYIPSWRCGFSSLLGWSWWWSLSSTLMGWFEFSRQHLLVSTKASGAWGSSCMPHRISHLVGRWRGSCLLYHFVDFGPFQGRGVKLQGELRWVRYIPWWSEGALHLAVADLDFDVFIQLLLGSLQCSDLLFLQQTSGVLVGNTEEGCSCFFPVASAFLDPFSSPQRLNYSEADSWSKQWPKTWE